MIPLVGALGIGFEVSNWYLTTRGMQNAADSAAIAAATNGGANYAAEAKAVSATYGFVDGTNTISVAVTNAAPCPDGGNNCYSVSISGVVPLYLSQIVGFAGNTMLNGAPAERLSATAVAQAGTQPQNVCLLALTGSGAAQGIRTNGSPVANMNGCNVMSNTAAQCNGSNLGAGYGFAHGTSNNCGVTPVSNVPVVMAVAEVTRKKPTMVTPTRSPVATNYQEHCLCRAATTSNVATRCSRPTRSLTRHPASPPS